MSEEQVILVDEKDTELGKMDKLEAHQKAILHRAFSIIIFNSKGQMLLQQRAQSKYHSGGLWSNACCSHPRPGEKLVEAASRRLHEELGLDIPMEKIFDFIYQSKLENGLTEHEFDHVFVGEYDGTVNFNVNEVQKVIFTDMSEIKKSLQAEPGKFTSWFNILFPRVEAWWQEKYGIRDNS